MRTTNALCAWHPGRAFSLHFFQALPQWKALSMARFPVAISVEDCSRVTTILQGTKVKTDEDRRRLQGPGLLVFDVGLVASADLAPGSFYLATSSSSKNIELVDGAALSLSGRSGLAVLLFLAR